ncbi:nucleolar protein 19 [[Candida] anglica]|uniref:Nucleolar protein 19 n=1 Tax=[Candida] anglica TaxID=148631 RepID=A0ABP0ELL0_9ASCO
MSEVTKPNRRKEIKAKEALQAQFQLAIARNHSKISSWLSPETSTATDANDSQVVDNSSFYNLPIIPNGSGLAAMGSGAGAGAGSGGAGLNKVGDFMASTEAGGMKKIKAQTQARAVTASNESKAMTALRNNLRNKSRDNVQKKFGAKQQQQQPRPASFVKQQQQQQQQSKSHHRATDGDSDDEDMNALKSRSVKKSMPLAFGGKKKKGGRPF